MAEFTGKYLYRPAEGPPRDGFCRLHFDKQTFTLTPDSGPVIAFDLGDVDTLQAGDWEIRLNLYTGATLVLSRLAKAYDNLLHDLVEAYRARSVQCLLLDDLEEIERFQGSYELVGAHSGSAEIRLYKSNVAVLASDSRSFQWRLADIDSVQFDTAGYQVVLRAGQQQLTITRLAKRTEEFVERLRHALNNLKAHAVDALRAVVPFLSPDQLQTLAGAMREGRSTSMTTLGAIDPRIAACLSANVIDEKLRPYFDLLTAQSRNNLFAGFKFMRAKGRGEDQGTAEMVPAEELESADRVDAQRQALFWFFFPLTGPNHGTQTRLVAWEATSESGRATYFFRLGSALTHSNGPSTDELQDGIEKITRALGILNFRRRPIYLSDAELDSDPAWRRYVIARRRIPEVQQLRANFIARAIHGSVGQWKAQVAEILQTA
jgi:hypothetical protein